MMMMMDARDFVVGDGVGGGGWAEGFGILCRGMVINDGVWYNVGILWDGGRMWKNGEVMFGM